jgi:hypothetical protein
MNKLEGICVLFGKLKLIHIWGSYMVKDPTLVLQDAISIICHRMEANASLYKCQKIIQANLQCNGTRKDIIFIFRS